MAIKSPVRAYTPQPHTNVRVWGCWGPLRVNLGVGAGTPTDATGVSGPVTVPAEHAVPLGEALPAQSAVDGGALDGPSFSGAPAVHMVNGEVRGVFIPAALAPPAVAFKDLSPEAGLFFPFLPADSLRVTSSTILPASLTALFKGHGRDTATRQRLSLFAELGVLRVLTILGQTPRLFLGLRSGSGLRSGMGFLRLPVLRVLRVPTALVLPGGFALGLSTLFRGVRHGDLSAGAVT